MGEIIQLSPKSANELRSSLPIKEGKCCLHNYVEIDTDEHELRCQQCDARVEPWDFVLSWAYHERNQMWTLKELKQQIDKFKAERDQLQKEVANLKAQKRRLA